MKFFKIGACKIDITPPVGYILEGHTARNKPSIKIHDQLYLKCLSIFDGNKRVFIITSDLIGFPPDFVISLKEEIYNKFKIPSSYVLLTASHTHTGPLISNAYYYSEKPLPDYISLLKKKIIGGIIHCLNDEEEGIIKFGKGNVNIGIVNRRKKTPQGIKMEPNFYGPIDDEVSVIKIERKDRTPKVILFNYSCHPTTLSTDIYEISGDYPKVAQREIERFYPLSIAMFTNGACGDVRPAIIKDGKFKGGNFEDIERMGKILSGEVIKVCERAEKIDRIELDGISKFLKFRFEKKLIPDDEKELSNLIKIYKEKYFNVPEEWVKFMKDELKKGRKLKNYVKGEIQVIKIGDIFLLGLPGEVMVEIGLKIKKRLKNRKLIICGYSNGLIGYIPTTDALKEGGYEISSFLYELYPAPFSEKNLIENSINLIK